MRVLFTAEYNARFVGSSAIVINDGVFINPENNPTLTGTGTEDHDNLKKSMADGNVLTSYETTENKGELVYHLSEDTAANHVRLIADVPTGTTVKVSVRTLNEAGESVWKNLGKVKSTFQTFALPGENPRILDVKVAWDGGPAEFYELSTFTKEVTEDEIQPEEPEKPETPLTPIATDVAKRVLEDAATGVKIAGKVTDLEQVANVVVQKVPDQTLQGKNYDAYDIRLLDKDGHSVQPKAAVLVSLPAKEGGEVDKVYYITPSKTLESLPFTQEGGKVVFGTTHFSIYAVVYKGEVATAEPTTPTTPATPSTPANPIPGEQVAAAQAGEKLMANPAPQATVASNELPATGTADASTALFVASLSLALGALFLKKGKEEA